MATYRISCFESSTHKRLRQKLFENRFKSELSQYAISYNKNIYNICNIIDSFIKALLQIIDNCCERDTTECINEQLLFKYIHTHLKRIFLKNKLLIYDETTKEYHIATKAEKSEHLHFMELSLQDNKFNKNITNIIDAQCIINLIQDHIIYYLNKYGNENDTIEYSNFY